MEAEGNRGHDYTLPAQVKEQFQSMLEHYPSIRHVRDFIDIEQRLLASLKENLTSLPPSPLSLNLRTITTRHQQCLEKLGRELAGHPDK